MFRPYHGVTWLPSDDCKWLNCAVAGALARSLAYREMDRLGCLNEIICTFPFEHWEMYKKYSAEQNFSESIVSSVLRNWNVDHLWRKTFSCSILSRSLSPRRDGTVNFPSFISLKIRCMTLCARCTLTWSSTSILLIGGESHRRRRCLSGAIRLHLVGCCCLGCCFVSSRAERRTDNYIAYAGDE